MLKLLARTLSCIQTHSAHCWMSLVCCFLLVLGVPALWGSISPSVVRAAQTGSEEESRPTNLNEIKEEAPRPRDEEFHHRYCDVGQKPPWRPAGTDVSGRHLPEIVAAEHDLRNGLGAPLLC
ncbi:MAG: hypothetical protein HRU71_00620 [Planctomycetia bacterium]|nr:MAG: hypothetical protein HRU71_00620 [Planctomycetia bacterium]